MSRQEEFVQPGEVRLAIHHMSGCGCDFETPDPEATIVQLGCVIGYLVNGTGHRNWGDPADGEAHPRCGWCTAEGHPCPVHAGPWEST